MADGDPLSNVPPDEFVKARDALASQLRPSAALWIVNQLGRRAREQVDQLIGSTRQARRAQVEGRAGDELREAMRSQRDAMHRLLGEADQVAAGAGFDVLLSGPEVIAPKARPAAVEPKAGVAAVASRAATQKQAFEARSREQKRLLQERRDRMLGQREIQRAQLVAQRLAGRAEQLEKLAERTKDAAEKARSKAEEARRAANESAARLIELRAKP